MEPLLKRQKSEPGKPCKPGKPAESAKSAKPAKSAELGKLAAGKTRQTIVTKRKHDDEATSTGQRVEEAPVLRDGLHERVTAVVYGEG